MKAIEDIILEKNYSDLSVEELNIVSELADNEDEFNQMKQLFENMTLEFNSPEMFAPSSETKASLDQIFSAKHPVIANDWKKEEAVVDDVKVVAFYNRNWVRVAAIFLLFIGISVLFIKNSDEISGKNTIQQAGNEGPETRAKRSVDATSEKTETAAVLPPETREQANNAPVLAFAEDRSGNTEMKDEAIDMLAKTTIPNTAASGGAPAYTFSTSGESTSFALSATSPQPMTFTNSGFTTTTVYEKDKKSNWGRLADLDPELNMSRPTTASGGYESSVSKEGLAAEMLDWIQAAY